jgi:hypothetical protein
MVGLRPAVFVTLANQLFHYADSIDTQSERRIARCPGDHENVIQAEKGTDRFSGDEIVGPLRETTA